MTKAQIRSIQKELRNNLAPDERILLDKEIQIRLNLLDAFSKNYHLLSFVSFGSEVDTHNIIKHAIEAGNKVYIPRAEKQGMEFYQIKNLNNLISSRFGVPEPPKIEENSFLQHMNKEMSIPSDAMVRRGKDIIANIMLLPGLAFDYQGNRVGYGAGYYDKYFASHPTISFYKIALAYDFQVFDEIPANEFDIKANAIVTPTRVIYCKEQ